MELSGMLLLMFAIAIGFATFVENDFGTLEAKARVYNATWFELLLLLLAINMTGSIFKHKMISKAKWPILLFHVSFLVIFIGAAITRYISYEGIMSIREGQSSNEIVSDESYIRIWAQDGENNEYDESRVFAAYSYVSGFDTKLSAGDKKVKVEVLDYYTSAGETYAEEEGGDPMIWLVVSGNMSGRQNLYLKKNSSKLFNGYRFGFEKELETLGVQFSEKENQLYMVPDDSVSFMNMMAGTTVMLAPDSLHAFQAGAVYKIGSVSFVLKQFYKSAKRKLISTDNKGGIDAFLARVTVGDQYKDVEVFGGKGFSYDLAETIVNGVKVQIAYGSKTIKLPFSIKLEDFQLERYPGSNSPSSYASEVIVVDPVKNVEIPYRIFMNNVLNYGGYRFFQSSYDKDELGTVLSVNHDNAGTIITYLGYFLMTLGMIVSIFTHSSRFRSLLRFSSKLRESRKTTAIFVLLVAGSMFMVNSTLQAQNPNDKLPVIDEHHASEFGKLLVQDKDGRIKPVNTVASEVLRKVAYKLHFEGMNPEQTFLGILVYPELWQSAEFIKIGHPETKEIIGTTKKRAAFNQIVDLRSGQYKLSEYIDQAYAKKPSQQSKFDKDVMKVDERVNIFYMVYSRAFLTVFPVPGDPGHKWVNEMNTQDFKDEEETLFVKGIFTMYFDEVKKAVESGSWEKADEYLGYILQFQEKYGSKIAPSQSVVNLEIMYNRINPFKRLTGYYGYVGFILIVLHFINILRPKINLRIVTRIASVLVILLFVMHTAGLGVRWYISGHAPWSNGYESLIYIGWATILSGIIFVKRSPVTLSVTALLTSLILAVAGMSWMDPEITNLVPVLKSYWLIIHVAIITASYGFLALGAMLGFFNLILMNLKTKSNHQRLDHTVIEIGYIIEMTLIVGLFMLTIGTFLGGVWANESWGRYWGWDPKETWALVTVLVYSFVLHMRFIPGFKGMFPLSFASLISFSTVLMTYFGVNYYLSGLHSYAKGDPVPVPSFVYYTLIVVGIVSIMAYISNRRIEKG